MAWAAAPAMGRAARRGVQREPARVQAADRAAVPAMDREDAVRAPDPGCVKAWGRERVRGAALLTDEERTAHRAKMQSLASYDECKSYMADFSKQIQARAKEKGQAVGGPNEAMCDRMKAHGRFTQ